MGNHYQKPQIKEIGCQEFVELIQLIIDDEASEEEKAAFQHHAEKCKPCAEHYNLDCSLLSLIKQKLNKQAVPQDLAQEIREKIRQIA